MNENDLRDCFAMFAMNGMARYFDFAEFKDDPMRVAKWSYDVADAMMEARKPKEKNDEEDTGIASVAKRSYKRKS